EQAHRFQRGTGGFRGAAEPALRGDAAESGGQGDHQHDQDAAVEHGASWRRGRAIIAARGGGSMASLYTAWPRRTAPRTRAMTTHQLQTIIDLIRYGASRFNAAGLTFGHSYDNALDEATQLTLHALHLPHDLSPVYGQARVTEAEKEEVLALFIRRIEERVPAAYLCGEAWFAGLSFKSD